MNLILRFVRRELRSTEARILVLALALAVASVGAVALNNSAACSLDRARCPRRVPCGPRVRSRRRGRFVTNGPSSPLLTRSAHG